METEAGIFAIGKYRVIGTLGRGAMGVVYKAQDPEIGRIVAVKVLRSLESESEKKLQSALEQFKTEARSAGNLRHPHIITVFEVSSQDASPYIVMDYIEGQGLDQLLARQGAMTPDQALPLLRQIAEGLDHAHERGVIHRDIKPSNILIDSQGRAFIVDFGVATIGRSRTEGGAQVAGSPGYMSPEQILAKKVDHFSDLFSFAILAFEVLSGVRPFDGDTFNKVVSQILNSEPRSISALRPAYPLDVEVIFERALSKRPSARFPRAIDFVTELEKAFSRSRPESRGGKSDTGAYKRKPSLWGALDIDGSVKRTDDTSLPAIALVVESAKQAARDLESADEWKRPEKKRRRTDSGIPPRVHGHGTVQPPFGFAGQADEIAPKVSLFRHANRRATRMLAGLIAFMLIGTGIALCWIFYQDLAAPVPTPAPATETLESPVAPEPEKISAPEFPKLPEALEPGRFDLPDLAHSVNTMGDRELLGVIATGDFPIDDILKAMVLSDQRSISGRYEATVYLLNNDSYVLRVEALKSLARSDDRRFVPAVLLTLDDRDPLVRIAAANALRDFGDRKVVSYLTARMRSEQLPEVKGALRRAIEKLNGFPLGTNF